MEKKTEPKGHARGPNDANLHDGPAAPSQSGRSGGAVSAEVPSRDEESQALGGDPEPTRVTKKDKVQPATRTRSDHRGASR
jgi:hypothetical protein